MRSGVLLVNLGTPDAPSAGAVRRYLREFLSDPRVIDIAAPARLLLVNAVIAPLRAPRSAAAYRKVWSERGSPLLANGLDLRDALRPRLAPAPVELAMRYGRPSLAEGMAALVAAGCERVVCAPLYPQYAASSTGSSVEALYRLAGAPWNTPYLDVLPPFHSDARFLDALAARARPFLEALAPDHVLFSYHGLPERHCTKSDPTSAHCLRRPDCCDALVEANRACYRAHCFATTRGLLERLALGATPSSVAFQSRLGRTPWIRPFTDVELVRLAQAGVRKLAVLCPSFVADCLETLEEIGLRGQEAFRAAGGSELVLVPGLNAAPEWVEALASMLAVRLGTGERP